LVAEARRAARLKVRTSGAPNQESTQR
jgi:hypothetical protein